jgi:hypothetical protein
MGPASGAGATLRILFLCLSVDRWFKSVRRTWVDLASLDARYLNDSVLVPAKTAFRMKRSNQVSSIS